MNNITQSSFNATVTEKSEIGSKQCLMYLAKQNESLQKRDYLKSVDCNNTDNQTHSRIKKLVCHNTIIKQRKCTNNTESTLKLTPL